MAKTKVVYYADSDGRSPLLARFDEWPDKVLDKCNVRIRRLQEMGHELRRPEADFLRDGIYELRVRNLHVNYRILYFFSGRTAVLFNGLTKQDVVPANEIEQALTAREVFARDPVKHTYGADKDEG